MKLTVQITREKNPSAYFVGKVSLLCNFWVFRIASLINFCVCLHQLHVQHTNDKLCSLLVFKLVHIFKPRLRFTKILGFEGKLLKIIYSGPQTGNDSNIFMRSAVRGQRGTGPGTEMSLYRSY